MTNVTSASGLLTSEITEAQREDFAAAEYVFPDANCDAAVVFHWLASMDIPLRRPWELLVRAPIRTNALLDSARARV